MQILKDWDKMCKSFEWCHDGDGCEIMRIIENEGTATNCGKFVRENPERAIEIIERWIEEHPQKTYKDDLLTKLPNVILDAKGLPVACRKNLYGEYGGCADNNCKECWNEPMKG